MSEDLSDKITDLESRLEFQEDYLQTLNNRIVEQENDIAKMYLQLQHLSQKLKDNQDSTPNGFAGGDERPPHY